jgi:rubrerythrin
MFEKILFKTVLEQAIAAEERAFRYYQHAAERTDTQGAADLLTYLAGEELLHRIKLEELQREGNFENLMLKNIQAAGKTLGGAVVSNEKETLLSILQTALEKEKNAHFRYSSMGDSLSGKKQEGLFRLLAAEEKKHMDLITDYLNNAENAEG